jgi:hypothetical protein
MRSRPNENTQQRTRPKTVSVQEATGIQMSDLDGIAAVKQVCPDQPTPIILVLFTLAGSLSFREAKKK